ncbi:uncharacterized protein BJ212DRAFT_189528 [Suillus subaureus]|uniref:PUL domain-containing protein n=1 Tax=Suillus subaureus TaxID=48587 RepID=A0A9P7EAV3_9AGAM|nr:uncharacterized protein BJ212DRAFT_189528 [Suillus subaureus]KAG1816377.1 hypothetical protein BJ212DRAFT_189528 [Suillus subaureus]
MKLRGFLDSATTWFQPFDTSLSKADTMEILVGTMIPYVKAFTTSQCLPLHPLFDLWHDVTSSMSWNMPEDQLFPLVDLWRIALLDEKVSSWCADRNGLDSPLVLLLSKACEWSSKKYLLALLRMLSNAFSNRALGWKILLSAQNNLAILLEHTLVHEDTGVRKSASSLTFNTFAHLQELRIENLCKGDEEGADHLEMDISMTLLNAEWEASIACAVLAAIEYESDGDTGIIGCPLFMFAIYLSLSDSPPPSRSIRTDCAFFPFHRSLVATSRSLARSKDSKEQVQRKREELEYEGNRVRAFAGSR